MSGELKDWKIQVKELRRNITHFKDGRARKNLKKENRIAITQFTKFNARFIAASPVKKAYSGFMRLLSTLDYLVTGAADGSNVAKGEKGLKAIDSLLEVVIFQLEYSLAQAQVINDLNMRVAEYENLLNRLRNENAIFEQPDRESVADNSTVFGNDPEEDLEDVSQLDPSLAVVDIAAANKAYIKTLFGIFVHAGIASDAEFVAFAASLSEPVVTAENAKKKSGSGEEADSDSFTNVATTLNEQSQTAAQRAGFKMFNDALNEDIAPMGCGLTYNILKDGKVVCVISTTKSGSNDGDVFLIVNGIVKVFAMYYFFDYLKYHVTLAYLTRDGMNVEISKAILNTGALGHQPIPVDVAALSTGIASVTLAKKT